MLTVLPGRDLKAKPQIESKIKTWKKQYISLASALMTSGIGWNDTERSLDIQDDDVWNNYVKKDPSIKRMRNKPYPYYEDWCLIFGKDRATGEGVEAPGDAVEDIECEKIGGNDDTKVVPDDMDIQEDTDGSASVTKTRTNKGKNVVTQGVRKRGRGADVWVSSMNEMVVAFGAFFDNTNNKMSGIAQRIGFDHDMAAERRKVNGQRTKLGNLTMTERLKVASLIVNHPHRVDLFFSLPEDEQEAWVKLLLAGEI